MTKKNVSINVSVTFRHTESTPALKAYATEKITSCLEKYVNHDSEVQIILLVEKRDHIAEVIVRSKGHDASAKGITDDLYSAIDKVGDTIDGQLRKQKERQIDTKRTAV